MIRSLSKPLDFSMMHIDLFADYMPQREPGTVSKALPALLVTGGTQTMKLNRRHEEVFGKHQIMLKADGFNMYTNTYVMTDSDQVGQMYLG